MPTKTLSINENLKMEEKIRIAIGNKNILDVVFLDRLTSFHVAVKKHLDTTQLDALQKNFKIVEITGERGEAPYETCLILQLKPKNKSSSLKDRAKDRM
jgi:hypothetical protein